MDIKILAYNKHQGASKSLQGKFNFELNLLERVDATSSRPMTIVVHDCCYWIKQPAEEYITFPEKNIKQADGKWTKAYNYCSLSTPKGELQREVLKALRQFIKEMENVPEQLQGSEEIPF